MKKTVLSLFLVSISFIAFSQNIKTVEILTSAQCSMCKETLESNIAFEKGIKDVFLDMESKKLKVTFKSNKTTIEEIKKAVSLLGYDADDIAADPKVYKELPLCCQKPEDGGGMIHH